tara:strand:+ start:103122 stop:103445 length:324 start_codon:yes stop_codon:yes gene_type:complete
MKHTPRLQQHLVRVTREHQSARVVPLGEHMNLLPLFLIPINRLPKLLNLRSREPRVLQPDHQTIKLLIERERINGVDQPEQRIGTIAEPRHPGIMLDRHAIDLQHRK